MRNADFQGRVVRRTPPARSLRIPHSPFRILSVTFLPLVPVLVGPTAVGKTAVAAAWGAREPITVVSADARQVYRGLDIGTAKPAPAVLADVPHVGHDVVDPGERYSAGWFGGWITGAESPPPAVLADVPHVGRDVVDPGERYSAGRFARDAARWLE